MTLLSVFSLAAQLPVPLIDMPFERHSDQIWLKATVNGKPVNAILDTGAGESIVDTGLVVGVKGKPRKFAGTGPAEVVGWSIDWTGIVFGNGAFETSLNAALPIADLSPTEEHPLGVILGYGFFRPNVVEIDYVKSRVRVYEAATYQPPKDFEATPIQFVNRIPTIEGHLALPNMAERPVTMELDTGSVYGIDLSYRMVLREGLDKVFNSLPTVETNGGIGGPRRSRAVGSSTGRLGGKRFSAVARMILTGKKTTSLDYDYDVTLGDEALRRFTLIFDYSRSMLYFKPNGQ